jgi:hypothetical protein
LHSQEALKLPSGIHKPGENVGTLFGGVETLLENSEPQENRKEIGAAQEKEPIKSQFDLTFSG